MIHIFILVKLLKRRWKVNYCGYDPYHKTQFNNKKEESINMRKKLIYRNFWLIVYTFIVVIYLWALQQWVTWSWEGTWDIEKYFLFSILNFKKWTPSPMVAFCSKITLEQEMFLSLLKLFNQYFSIQKAQAWWHYYLETACHFWLNNINYFQRKNPPFPTCIQFMDPGMLLRCRQKGWCHAIEWSLSILVAF